MATNNDPRRVVEELQQLFGRFSLTGYEARVLSSLVRFGAATANQLSEYTGIIRQNVYPVLDTLMAKNLAEKRPGTVATWTCPKTSVIVARLKEAEARRLQDAHEALEAAAHQTEELLARLDTAKATGAQAITEVGEERLGDIYEKLMAGTREILVVNRGPYPGEVLVDRRVLAALQRGATARALYQGFELEGPDGSDLKGVADAYVEAGVESRVASSLPVAMAILDGAVCLLSIPGGESSDRAYPINFVIENRTLAELLTLAFDHMWEQSQPYEEVRESASATEQPNETAAVLSRSSDRVAGTA